MGNNLYLYFLTFKKLLIIRELGDYVNYSSCNRYGASPVEAYKNTSLQPVKEKKKIMQKQGERLEL